MIFRDIFAVFVILLAAILAACDYKTLFFDLNCWADSGCKIWMILELGARSAAELIILVAFILFSIALAKINRVAKKQIKAIMAKSGETKLEVLFNTKLMKLHVGCLLLYGVSVVFMTVYHILAIENHDSSVDYR